jgi:hypothetical protein
MPIDNELWTNYFTFLDNLRESGITNMFGAGPYLADAFDIPKSDANKIVSTWMETFSDDPPSIRAMKVT